MEFLNEFNGSIFRNLPQELIIHIYEFNSEHRKLLSDVMEELIDYTPEIDNYHICKACDNEITGEVIISTCLGITGRYCSDYCCWDIEYDMRKSYRRSARMQYQSQESNIDPRTVISTPE